MLFYAEASSGPIEWVERVLRTTFSAKSDEYLERGDEECFRGFRSNNYQDSRKIWGTLRNMYDLRKLFIVFTSVQITKQLIQLLAEPPGKRIGRSFANELLHGGCTTLLFLVLKHKRKTEGKGAITYFKY